MNTESILCFFILATSVCGDDEQIETVTKITPSGLIKGLKTVNNQTGKPVVEFRGIPYAKPPVGPLRFKKPERIEVWKDTLDATSFGAGCPQHIIEGNEIFAPSDMSEDCLLLNIYIPWDIEPKTDLSVMVWLHPGGLQFGYSHQYDGGWIATDGNVIVITINFRLNIFGFLSLDHPAGRGNYGLWDQHMAFQWVHDNVAAFGGDPNSVTIFGESGGSWGASFQSLIPLNRGLLQRVICQSGVVSRISVQTKKDIKKMAEDIAKKTGCPVFDMVKLADCLREKTMDELLKITDVWSTFPDDKLPLTIDFMPVVDGELYLDHPIRLLEDHTSEASQFFRSLDFIAGTTSNEGLLLSEIIHPSIEKRYGFNFSEGIPTKFVCEVMISPFVDSYFNSNETTKQKLCDFYTARDSLTEQALRASDFISDIIYGFGYPTIKMLEYHVSAEGKTFQYVFSKNSDFDYMERPKWQTGVSHGFDLFYMFDLHNMAPQLGYDILSPSDRNFSTQFIEYWTSFAKTGQPNGGEGSVPWKQFDLKERNYLDIDIPCTQKRNWNADMYDFWSNQLPEIELETGPGKANHDEL